MTPGYLPTVGPPESPYLGPVLNSSISVPNVLAPRCPKCPTLLLPHPWSPVPQVPQWAPPPEARPQWQINLPSLWLARGVQAACFGLSDWDSTGKGRGTGNPYLPSRTVVPQSSPVLLGLLTFKKCLESDFYVKDPNFIY